MSDIVVSNLPVLVDVASVGIQGAQGLQGVQGPVGPIGPTGPQGLPGAAVGIGEAPTDGTIYGRKGNTATWLNVLGLSTGGTVSAATTFSSTLAASGGGSVAGTFSGTPTWSGAHTFQSGITVTGSAGVNANNSNFGRGNTYTLSGGSLDVTKMGLYASNNIIGTSTLGEIPAVAYVVCASANVNAGATNLVDTMMVTMVTGGTNAVAGSWQTLSVNCNDGALATNDKAGGGAGGFLAMQIARRGAKNQGGTGLTPSTCFGSNWGIDIVNVLTPGATNHYLQNGLEINQSVQAGASVVRRAGLQISSPGTHVNRGALFDNGILIANGAGAAPLRNGIMFGSLLGGVAPLGTDSGVLVYQIGADRLAPANIGIDFNDCTFTTAAMRMPGGFSVSPAGALQLSTAFLTPTATGLSIDATGSVATGAPAITSGGSGYNPGEIMEDGYGGVYYNNSVASGAVTTIVVIVQPTYPTTSPPATLTMISRPAGVGTGCVLTLTWSTTRTGLSLNPTGRKIGFNGTAPIAQPAGWAAATGTATRSTFVTTSVTLPTLAEHVKALIDDLTSYGLIGP